MNTALVAAIAVKDDRMLSMHEGLADFLGVSPLLCEVDNILNIADNRALPACCTSTFRSTRTCRRTSAQGAGREYCPTRFYELRGGAV